MDMQYSRIYRSIWSDRKFEALAPNEKYVFLWVLTHPRITPSGVIELSLPQAELMLGLERDAIIASLKELTASGMVQLDEETLEVVIINHDKYHWRQGLTTQGKAVVKDIESIQSASIRTFVISRANYYWPDLIKE